MYIAYYFTYFRFIESSTLSLLMPFPKVSFYIDIVYETNKATYITDWYIYTIVWDSKNISWVLGTHEN